MVSVFISTAWFLAALAMSIVDAFGALGSNATAHDLALGCLLAWLPVLILCSIVDRNPVATEEIRHKLNKLVDRVRESLVERTVREKYIATIRPRHEAAQVQIWIEQVSQSCWAMENFFVKFAGQGRVRWHYGCSHPIIRDIERAYIARVGRNWLASEQKARTALARGDIAGGLDWWDYRELWQILGAVLIVGGTTLGAFVLSYYQPVGSISV